MSDVTTATAATTGDNGAAAQQQTAAAPATSDWTATLPDELKGFVQNKGWKELSAAIEGYRNLEKHVGVSADKLLRLPDWEKADKTELDTFYNRLGRPADKGQYELELPDGADPSFAEWAKDNFHELGLTAKQAKDLSSKWNQYVAGQLKSIEDGYQTKVANDTAALKQEWGAGFDKQLALAKNAAAAFGLTDDQVNAFARSVGPAAANKFFANIGNKMGEHNFISGTDNFAFGNTMTPAQAQAAIKSKMADKDFATKYLNGNAEARAEMERLHRFAAGVA
jgi:hypothetical protein